MSSLLSGMQRGRREQVAAGHGREEEEQIWEAKMDSGGLENPAGLKTRMI